MAVDAEMVDGAREATAFLKALANEHRLLILCHLLESECTVSDLEKALDLRQPTLSQQLARLRGDNLVDTRRDGKNIYYSLADDSVAHTLELLFKLFCSDEAKAARRRAIPLAS
ncbi:MAG: ArsR/SmtB family transcription factor [Magnetovibrionaceae bacterium]